jgi:hypothetical protein
VPRLGDGFAHDVDALGLEPVEMSKSRQVGFLIPVQSLSLAD